MIVAMLRRYGWILIALALFAAYQWWRSAPPALPSPDGTPPVATPSDTRFPGSQDAALPREARQTLQRILAGGPHPYRQDGGVFQNRERLLPLQPRGHYREYTVDTPGLDHRGARRIVTGGDPPAEWYYTADHYRSFRRFERSPAR